MHRSYFIKQHPETVAVWNYQNADCNLRKKFYCVIYYNFPQTSVCYDEICRCTLHDDKPKCSTSDVVEVAVVKLEVNR